MAYLSSAGLKQLDTAYAPKTTTTTTPKPYVAPKPTYTAPKTTYTAPTTPTRTPTTAYDKTGAAISGAYIENGKTYYGNGTPIGIGTKVVDNSGREWVKNAGGGTLTGNDMGIDTGTGGDLGGSTAPTYDPTQTINDLAEAQKQAQAAALQKQLNNQLSNVDSQYASIDSNAYDARNVAASESDVGALNFAQRAAARGISGNAGSMPEIYRNSALQGRVGAIDSQALGYKNNLDSQKTNLQNAYESDLVAAQQGIEATRLQNYIDQMNIDKTNSFTEAGLTGTYNGQQTMQGTQQQLSNEMAQLNIDAQTIQNSYLPQTLKDQATLLQQQVEVGKLAPATALAQLAQIKRQTANIGASEALGYANLANNQQQDAISNANEAYQNAISNINSLYVTSDAVTGGTNINKTGLRAYILSLNLPDAQTDQLIALYGVPRE